MRRHKNFEWDVTDVHGKVQTWEMVQVSVLMDIRDELQQLNRLLGCPNFIAVPALLRDIKKNTTKKRRKKKA